MSDQRLENSEPWMRGTHGEIAPVLRAVVHALELAEEDAARWAEGVSEEELFAEPLGLPSVAFQLRHMARSLDRLLTYAEGRMLAEEQLRALRTERDPGKKEEVLGEFRAGLARAKERMVAFGPEMLGEERGIGRKQLPTTVAGLLIHCAEHTQRHAGQMVTTVKVVWRGRLGEKQIPCGNDNKKCKCKCKGKGKGKGEGNSASKGNREAVAGWSISGPLLRGRAFRSFWAGA